MRPPSILHGEPGSSSPWGTFPLGFHTPLPTALHPVGKTIVDLSRRDILKFGVLGSAALLLPIERVARTESATAGRLDTGARRSEVQGAAVRPEARDAHVGEARFDVDFYDFTMKEVAVPVLNVPGGRKTYAATRIWGYNGVRPGPNIHVEQGRATIVRHINGLAGKYTRRSTTSRSRPSHLHGSASLPEYDGYASDVREPDLYKDYRYPNIQDARTLWYHDHGVHETASNAYMGLAAQYLLHDANGSAACDIPSAAERRVRRRAHRPRRDLRHRRPAHLRRQQRVVGHGRRDPRQRQAVAEDEGRAAPVPLPHPQRRGLPLLQVRPHAVGQRHERRSADDGDRDGRRPDAQAADGRRPSATAWPSATRSSSTSRSSGARRCTSRTSGCRTTSTYASRGRHALRRRSTPAPTSQVRSNSSSAVGASTRTWTSWA